MLKDPVEIIKSMGKFMTHTNEMLAKLEMKTSNLQIDIDKLKKDKNNGRIIG